MYSSYIRLYNHRVSYENFKCNVCHHLKAVGDTQFIIDILSSKIIHDCFNKKWYGESFYLLGMLDYISRINDIPICTDYNYVRELRLPKEIYPTDIYCAYFLTKDKHILEDSYNNAIPEFKRFNIIENEVRDVV